MACRVRQEKNVHTLYVNYLSEEFFDLMFNLVTLSVSLPTERQRCFFLPALLRAALALPPPRPLDRPDAGGGGLLNRLSGVLSRFEAEPKRPPLLLISDSRLFLSRSFTYADGSNL